MRTRWIVAAVLMLGMQAGAQSPPATPFFPVAVWYSGGTARAPMVSPIDTSGYLLDGWNNRVRYAVVDVSALLAGNTRFVFTASKGMQQRTLSSLATDPNLRICANSGCSTVLASAAVAVLVSQGRNGATAAAGSDELENLDGDTDFVSHEPTAATAAGGEFDDIVTWLSPNTLYNRMIAAGRLP